MPSQFQYHVRLADWQQDEAAIANLRREVFITEQHVPEHLEWEEDDARHQWFVAESRVGLIGIARLTAAGRIGRMAVRRPFRGKGVGTALLQAALDAARQAGMRDVHLSAQTHAEGFYARQGFVAEGEVYMDAGIAHRDMVYAGAMDRCNCDALILSQQAFEAFVAECESPVEPNEALRALMAGDA